ncbi:MAG: hypothetical protein GY874_08330 [Desulfobacteraceae bacterium]|nr:hypothetical protein [Desulfobacteraceae bacterium]
MKKHFGRICENADCELAEFNGESDYVHILVDACPKLAPK